MEEEYTVAVLDLFDTTSLTIQKIADTLGITYKMVSTRIAKNRSKEVRQIRKRKNYRKSKMGDKNPMKGKYGERHPNYVGEVGDGNGYLMILKPDWYTGRKGCKHVFVHSLVMCEALGITEIPSGFVIHHIDKDPHNNNINNLALMVNGAHSRLHHSIGKCNDYPQGVED